MTREARTVSSTRLRRTAVVVAFAALALTGCSASQAGAASIVGGQPVRDTALLDWLRDLVDAVLLEPVAVR